MFLNTKSLKFVRGHKMKVGNFARYRLSATVGALLLASCGASQSRFLAPPGQQGALRHVSSSSKSILYVNGSNFTAMYTYPNLSVIGKLQPNYTLGVGCADDATGYIYFTANPNGESTRLLQYAIGGTTKVGTIRPTKNHVISGCAADPTTGNLAVLYTGNKPGFVRIFASGSWQPTKVRDPIISTLFSSAYDDSGNLFVEGWNSSGSTILTELVAGGSQFIAISVTGLKQGQLQWDGIYLAVRVPADHNNKVPPSIQRIEVSGSAGTIVGTTTLTDGYRGTWIQGDSVLAGEFGAHNNENITFYKYPNGGRPYKTFGPVGETVDELIVATAPSK
jgi:hypothetical protein